MDIPALDHDIIDDTFRCSNFLQIEEMKKECEPLNWFLKEDNYLNNYENF